MSHATATRTCSLRGMDTFMGLTMAILVIAIVAQGIRLMEQKFRNEPVPAAHVQSELSSLRTSQARKDFVACEESVWKSNSGLTRGQDDACMQHALELENHDVRLQKLQAIWKQAEQEVPAGAAH